MKSRRLNAPVTADCRRDDPPADRIERVTEEYRYKRERDIRRTFHISLDNALVGVAPSFPQPSSKLYNGQLSQVEYAWDNRWWTARLIELTHFSTGNIMRQLGIGISCQGIEDVRLDKTIAARIGNRIHTRIQRAYLNAVKNTPLGKANGPGVSLDNRVHFTKSGQSERLSTLAYKTPSSVYGAANFCLAGTRGDIIDFDRNLMWEIKPAGLAATAVLQLWAYLDNYEVARHFEKAVRGANLPPMEPGRPASLPREVTRQFTLTISPKVELIVKPFTVGNLPGLILYSVRLRSQRRIAEGQAALGAGRVVLQQLMSAAGRSALVQREAEIAFWGGATTVATGVALTSGVVLTAAGVGVLAVVAPAVTTSAAAMTARLAPTMIGLAASPQVFNSTTRIAVAEISKHAADTIIVSSDGQQFEMPPEALGVTMETGMAIGASGLDAVS